jgi:hypothetical protein
MEFLVYIIELAAVRHFDGDRVAAYQALDCSNVLDYYAETYEVSHTLSSSYLSDEIGEMLSQHGDSRYVHA